MAKYKRIVTTEAGLQLLASAVAGGTVTFTAVKAGSETYTGKENLSAATDLKSVRQTFSVSSVTRSGNQVKLRSVFTNDNLTEGYSMTEIGVYAKNPGTGADILYAIIVAELADYLPAHELAPTSITMEFYLELTEDESEVKFATEVIEGAYVPVESFNDHVADSVIHITAAERSTWNAKLSTTGNISNTTAAFTEASTLTALATGSKLSVLFGALAKAVSSLISHLANKNNPHGVTKSQVGLGNVDNTSDVNKPVSTAVQTELEKKALVADLTSHTGNTGNPHSVTKSQVGLGNVPNVATNDQVPTFTTASSLAVLVSGEKLSIALGKLAKAVSDLISHLANKSNPHGVTKSQVGLGNVDNTSDANKPVSTATQTELDKKALAADLTSHTTNTSNPHSVTKAQVGLSNVPNVATNDQTPSYTAASSLTTLTSGEKLSVAFGKLSKAVSSLISHLADSVGHITPAERTAWNAKLDATATAKNSEKLNGLSLSKFPRYYTYATDYNDGTNGSGLDFNDLIQVGFHLMAGNFNSAANKPKGFYGDDTVIVTGNDARITQITFVDDKICYRSSSWDGEFQEWKYSANAAKLKYSILDDTCLSTEIKDCASYTDLFSQLPDKCIFIGHTWNAPSWFPISYATNWHVKVEKYSNASVWIEIYSDAKPEWHYKAGWAYGTSWNGWQTIATVEHFKEYTNRVKLSTLTWTKSTNGKYYATFDTDIYPKMVLGTRISEWNMLYENDNLQLYTESGTTIGIMSNINTFHADAELYITMTYIG